LAGRAKDAMPKFRGEKNKRISFEVAFLQSRGEIMKETQK